MVKFSILFAAVIFLSVNLRAQTNLVSFGTSWKYLDNGSNQGTAWRSVSFNDSNWKTGKGKFGYGHKNEATTLSFGPHPADKYITTYFRKDINLDDASDYATFTARVKRDDGVVVYVNGSEVYRDNLPSGTIGYMTRAASAADNGQDARSFNIKAAVFASGNNVIAVEVHQTNNFSFDKGFDLELSGSSGPPPDDKSPPTVLHLNRHSPATEITKASSVIFRITFSEAVTKVGKSDFELAGTARGSIALLEAIGADGDTYDITVEDISGSGKLGLNLKNSGTGIIDEDDRPIQEGFTGQTYTIKKGTDQAGEVVLTRGPYLQMASQTAVTLRWRTDKPSDSQIEVGTSYGTYPHAAQNDTRTTEHEIRIAGLKAGTQYFYRFGSSEQVLQDGTDNYFTTAPAASNAGKVRIAILGDCGRNDQNIQTNTLDAYWDYVEDKPAELLLLLGDNAYQDGTDEEYQKKFFNAYSSTMLKNHVMFPAPGNHDYHTTSQASRQAPYYKVFTMPAKGESGGIASGTEAYYAYDWSNIHFISLDSYGTEDPDDSRLYDTLGAQVKWLKKDLAANKLPWVIVYWHHPPYSMGSHNSDTEAQMAKIRQNLLRILERNGVDLVLTGHSHNYERSYLLKGYYGNEASFNLNRHTASTSSGKDDGSKNSAPYKTSPGKTNHGTVYVVSGSAGTVGKVQSTWPHDAMPFSDNEGGMFYLEVEENRLKARYLRSDGKVWDQFTIIKDGNKDTDTPFAGSTLNPEAPGKAAMDTTLKIFPTLVSRGTRIMVQTPGRKQMQAQVVDLNGRLVSKADFNTVTYIETHTFPAGMYFIRLEGQNYLKTQKFMVWD